MTLDWDGRIRMDCSSPYAMASLIGRAAEFAIATGNDTDSDRHGIVTPDAGPARPQPLPGRGHRLPVPAPGRTGPAVPRSARPWSARRSSTGWPRRPAAADRGAGRVQVVRAGAAGRLHRVRRRGERRGVVPAHRRPGLDHRQGRHHPGPARLGDHRGDRAVAGRAVPRAGRPGSATRPTPGSTRPPPGRRRPLLAKLSPDQVSAAELAGEPVLDRLTTGPGQRRAARAASR